MRESGGGGREAQTEAPPDREEARRILERTSFEVVFARDLAGRFAQRRNFISDLEAAIPAFYEQVGQHLKAWQPQAPKIKEDRAEPADVGTAAMQKEAELVVEERNELEGRPFAEL